MQTSEHYELNLAEGTDTVNPLTIDVPNYETIDEAMYGNYLAGNGKATELLSGTVHAITREGEQEVFHFTATADWTAGDTMTVDGQQVTVKLPSGEALGTGAYVINSEVLCIIEGTLVTAYVPSGTVTEAANALKLGGELPEYYGTASAVASAASVANAANTLVEALNNNLAPLRDTLVAGRTTITFSSSRISSNAVIDVYVDIDHFGVNPTDISLSGTTVTLTFEAQDDNMEVGIMIF